MKFPKSWKSAEGNRPNVIQKWKSQNGSGENVATLLVQDVSGISYSKEEISLLAKDETELKAMIPSGGIIKGASVSNVDQQPALLIEYEN